MGGIYVHESGETNVGLAGEWAGPFLPQFGGQFAKLPDSSRGRDDGAADKDRVPKR